MTLNSKFEFSENFSGFRRFRTQQVNEWRKTSIVSDNVVSTSNLNIFGMLSRRAGLSATAGLSCSHVCYQRESMRAGVSTETFPECLKPLKTQHFVAQISVTGKPFSFSETVQAPPLEFCDKACQPCLLGLQRLLLWRITICSSATGCHQYR